MQLVVPYIGTWIETEEHRHQCRSQVVVPYIGTWIETSTNSETLSADEVVPYIGTWIETPFVRVSIICFGRTLYRYVD